MRPKYSGFTLIELVIVVVLISTIASIAVPGFRSMIESNRLTATANNTLGLLNYARSEAIKRGEPVQVQAKAGGIQKGLKVVLGSDTSIELRVGEKMPGDVTLNLQGGQMPAFNGRGEKLGDVNTIFRLCPGNGEPGVDVVVNRGGQANRAKAEPAC